MSLFLRKTRTRLPSFNNDESGSVALIFGITAFTLFLVCGLVLDFARAYTARSSIQAHADAALLAAVRANPDGTETELQTATKAYFKSASGLDPDTSNMPFQVKKLADGAQLRLQGKSPNTLLTIANYKKFDFTVMSQVKFGTGPMEIALVLDNTGSMTPHMSDLRTIATEFTNTMHAKATPGTLKIALVPYTGTVNIGNSDLSVMDTAGASPIHGRSFKGKWIAREPGCVPTTPTPGTNVDPGEGTSGGDRVNVQPSQREAPSLSRFAGLLKSILFGSPAQAADASDVPHGYVLSTDTCWLANDQNMNLFTDMFDRIPNVTWKGCVIARPAPYDVTDDAPDVLSPETMFVPWFWPDEPDQDGTNPVYANDYLDDRENNMPGTGTGPFNGSIWQYADANGKISAKHKYNDTAANIDDTPPVTRGPNQGCPTPITPLTDSQTTITTNIAAMQAWGGGGTNAHMGVVWGWRALSPGAPFTQGAPKGQAEKVIVLMTDGKNNIEPNTDSYGKLSEFSAYGYLRDRRIPGVDLTYAAYDSHIDSRMLAACTNAKADGVTIYTVTFGAVDSDTKTLYENCASSKKHAFAASDAAQLGKSFQAITKELSDLRLSK